jgi:hypothetical protein
LLILSTHHFTHITATAITADDISSSGERSLFINGRCDHAHTVCIAAIKHQHARIDAAQ